MGFFFKKANKTNRCLLCGSEVEPDFAAAP